MWGGSARAQRRSKYYTRIIIIRTRQRLGIFPGTTFEVFRTRFRVISRAPSQTFYRARVCVYITAYKVTLLGNSK